MCCMCRWDCGPVSRWIVLGCDCKTVETHTDPRQHNGSQHQSHNNFVWVRVCMCVQGASLFQSFFCLAYIMILWWIMHDRNLWRFHLNMRHQLEHDSGFLHVSFVSYYFTVLRCIVLHHKNTKSCKFPSIVICLIRWIWWLHCQHSDYWPKIGLTMWRAI